MTPVGNILWRCQLPRNSASSHILLRVVQPRQGTRRNRKKKKKRHKHVSEFSTFQFQTQLRTCGAGGKTTPLPTPWAQWPGACCFLPEANYT